MVLSLFLTQVEGFHGGEPPFYPYFDFPFCVNSVTQLTPKRSLFKIVEKHLNAKTTSFCLQTLCEVCFVQNGFQIKISKQNRIHIK